MVEDLRQRRHKRNQYSAPVMITNESAKEYHYAKLQNYGLKGLYFESDFKPEPESIVYIYMNKYSPKATPPENHKGYKARVKWSQEIIDEFTFYHGTGVEIFSTIK